MTAYLKRTARFGPASALLVGIFGFLPATAHAATLQLTDGRIVIGRLGETAGVAEDPTNPGPSAGMIRTTPILVIEDGLRRTFVHKTAVREVLDEADTTPVRVRVWQKEAMRGMSLGSIGAPTRVTEFDEYGRRIVELPSNHGPISVVQGVTEVNSVFTRVQGLRAEPTTYVWDMRLATSSLPRTVLSKILRKAVPQDSFDKRMQVVRLYLQSERYRDAARELETVRRDFAGRADVDAEAIDDNLRQLRDLAARALLDEIELRRDSGQPQLARSLLERFPADGVGGDTLQRVRELLDEDDLASRRRAELLTSLDETAAELTEPAARVVAERIVAEIRTRLSGASADRLTAFRQLADGGSLSSESLAAIAISGWLLGSNNAVESLPTALTLVRVREDIRRYLVEKDPEVRGSILVSIQESSASDVPRIAQLLARMEPPLPLVEPIEKDPQAPTLGENAAPAPSAEATGTLPPNCHELSVDVGRRTVCAQLQLPPEYDPLRRYPTIVTLGEIGAPASAQLDYWAGPPREEVGRIGQATRRGYIVLSVEWARPDQLRYEYTAEEHAAVLVSLRAALRRVSIDSDRVFLTGHGAGADLAWDLSLAHPDHWAGCLPFLGVADRYCGFYWKNAEHVPWRIVMGELDGKKLEANSRELDRYLRPRFDATVVEYRGRGYDQLSDDIQRSFDWMSRKQRAEVPDEFECTTMRTWDNYFWWIELHGLPKKSIVAPAEWPRRSARAAKVRGRKFTGNKLGIFTGAEKVTVWLSPDLVDFEEPIEIEHNGRRLVPRGERVDPDLRVLLEDARTRAERQRPYWAKVSSR